MKNSALNSLFVAGLAVGFPTGAYAQEEVPAPTVEMKVLGDQYSDAKVFFCDPTTAVVTIDPNKCGEIEAKGGKGCREAAGYNSGNLKAFESETGWELSDSKGQVLFNILKSEDHFRVNSTFGKKEEFQMNWKELPPQEIRAYKKYLRICS